MGTSFVFRALMRSTASSFSVFGAGAGSSRFVNTEITVTTAIIANGTPTEMAICFASTENLDGGEVFASSATFGSSGVSVASPWVVSSASSSSSTRSREESMVGMIQFFNRTFTPNWPEYPSTIPYLFPYLLPSSVMSTSDPSGKFCSVAFDIFFVRLTTPLPRFRFRSGSGFPPGFTGIFPPGWFGRGVVELMGCEIRQMNGNRQEPSGLYSDDRFHYSAR